MGVILNQRGDLEIFELLYPYYRQSLHNDHKNLWKIPKMVWFAIKQRARIIIVEPFFQ